MRAKKILVTGGAGFIGSALTRYLIADTPHEVLVVDKLTYAGSLRSLARVSASSRFSFVKADIVDRARMREVMCHFRPDLVMHLAAESHVDRSIDGPAAFIETNVVGTFSLLAAALEHWRSLPTARAATFRFHHVSTDEVFGSLARGGRFTEGTRYRPNSPYSATKAASDHLVRAWYHTYGLPVVLSNCSNNYGPYQFPEKLIPLTILNALEGKPLPVYGTGENVRDWLYVEDHVKALLTIAENGRIGKSYIVGGSAERRNIDVVRAICRFVDAIAPNAALGPRERLITFVPDRPGHDLRYAVDATKIRRELGWHPETSFEAGLSKTVEWFIANREWWEQTDSAKYHRERLGVPA